MHQIWYNSLYRLKLINNKQNLNNNAKKMKLYAIGVVY